MEGIRGEELAFAIANVSYMMATLNNDIVM